MVHVDLAFRKLVPVSRTASSESVLGFVVLRAVADVIARHTSLHDVTMRDEGFAVSLQVKEVTINLNSDTEEPIRASQHYQSLLLTADLSEKVDEFHIRSAFSRFIVDFHDFIDVECDKPSPELRKRVCRVCHRIVTWDETMQLWWCSYSDHGLLYEDETAEVPVNPFEF